MRESELLKNRYPTANENYRKPREYIDTRGPELLGGQYPAVDDNYRKAHKYMDMYVDGLVDEYRLKKENAVLIECVDKMLIELRGIRRELSEIKQQNERAGYFDLTRLTIAMGEVEQGKLGAGKSDLSDLFGKDELERIFGQNDAKPPGELPGEAPEELPEEPAGEPPEGETTDPPPISPEMAEPVTPEAPEAPETLATPDTPAPPPEKTNVLQKLTKLLPEKKKAAPSEKPKEAKEKKPKNKIGSIVSNVLFYTCMALMIVGAVTFAQSDDINKSLFGFRYYYIKTGSMEPVYSVGSVVFTQVTPAEEIAVGDDITVYVGDGATDTFLTHRVVEITTDQNGALAFRTKGVNNKSNDPTPYSAELLVGKVVFSIPFLGTVMTFVQTQLPFVIGMFVLLLLLSFMLRLLFKKEPEKKIEDEAANLSN